MAKAKDVYEKLQKDLDAAKRERHVLNDRVIHAQSAIASAEKQITSLVGDLLPWAEQLAPALFKEKSRLETEVEKFIATSERALYSFTRTHDEAAKIYSDMDAAHTLFAISENSRLNSDAIYLAALKDIEKYNEAEIRTQIDDLTAQVKKQEKKIGEHWLINVAYHNQYGQEEYTSQHFLQDLFGMLCVRVKRTKRYNNLIRELGDASEMLADAKARAEARASVAASATGVVNRMRSETRRLIESNAQESLDQKRIVETAQAALKTEALALDRAKAQDREIKAWINPIAKEAKNSFSSTLIGDSPASFQLRAALAVHKGPASIVEEVVKQNAKRSEAIQAMSDTEAQRKTLSETIDKLESLVSEMRRKNLSNSNREIEKADSFMAGTSIDTDFDLSTLVAVAIVMNSVVDTIPQDATFSASTFESGSYSSAFD